MMENLRFSVVSNCNGLSTCVKAASQAFVEQRIKFLNVRFNLSLILAIRGNCKAPDYYYPSTGSGRTVVVLSLFTFFCSW